MTHDQPAHAPVEVTALPCAHCGSEALIGQTLDDAWYAMCCVDHCIRIDKYWRTKAEAIAAWNTRHSAPDGEVEPVAWMYTHPKCTSYWRTQPDEGHAEDGWTETPLYTHPAPPADLVELVEAAWRAGFQTARECLPDYAADVLTEDVEHDQWLDSNTRAALAKHGGARDD